MIRVLQITDHLEMGGIQAFLMNLYRNINRDEVQFDFLIFRNTKQWYEDEIYELGGRIYKAPGRKKGIIKCYKYLNEFFKMHPEYKIIHYNASSLSFILPLKIAKKYNVNKRIIHCHSSSFMGNNIHKYLHNLHKKQINEIANVYLSCSKPATEWMYGNTPILNKVIMVKNGINCDEYLYSENIREEYRKKLNINNAYVVGHVGRFSKVKNHSFLIDIFCEIKKLQNNAVLLLVGDGELKNDIEKLAVSKSISSSVIFLGNRNDVSRLLQAMDILVMPSFYEGFPVTIIEAEASGLPIIMSDTITNEVCVNSNIKTKSLNESSKSWAIEALKNRTRIKTNKNIKDSGLDIKSTVTQLCSIYKDKD